MFLLLGLTESLQIMRIRFCFLVMIFLFGCSVATPVKPDSYLSEASQQESLPQTQRLPIEATVVIAAEKIKLEVARTPEQQAIGLMSRESLADNRGMLFIFDPPRLTRFWMKNVLISLDMIFMQQGLVIAIENDVPPCQSRSCPTYGPIGDMKIDQVLELKGGRAAALGLKVGDRLSIEFQPATIPESPQANPTVTE